MIYSNPSTYLYTYVVSSVESTNAVIKALQLTYIHMLYHKMMVDDNFNMLLQLTYIHMLYPLVQKELESANNLQLTYIHMLYRFHDVFNLPEKAFNLPIYICCIAGIIYSNNVVFPSTYLYTYVVSVITESLPLCLEAFNLPIYICCIDTRTNEKYSKYPSTYLYTYVVSSKIYK